MADLKKPLPEYDQPPVIETLLGVQFNPLERFSIPHVGLYWAKIKQNYPNQEVQPPLGPRFEKFGDEKWPRSGIQLELLKEPEVRTWFIDKSGTRLIQLQRDRFIHNWRRMTEADLYPRYASIKPKFFEEWEGFCGFLQETGFKIPEINQCEITYVNHIELGPHFGSFGEVKKVIAPWSGNYSGDFLSLPETVLINMSFIIPNEQGRLHVVSQRAIRTRDAKEVLQLTLTARGKPISSRTEDISDWFELGHKWIVRGFTDLTTADMHKLWRRTV